MTPKVPWWQWIVAFMALPMLAVGWVVIHVLCGLGFHEWLWRPRLHVPHYGYGAWSRLMCDRVKVKP